MAKKNDKNYFEMLTDLVGYSCREAAFLMEILTDFDASTLEEKMQTMHEIEHEADIAKHVMTEHLVKEFITPIDREDIVILTDKIDEVTDCIDDVLLKMYMYNVAELNAYAFEFAEIIDMCCLKLTEVFEELKNFKKSKTIVELIAEVNRLEGEGDVLYTKAMRKLYGNGAEVMDIMRWNAVYDALEKCCDACEHAADAVQTIVMKNS